MIQNIFTEDFLTFIYALTLLMLANLATGVMKAYKAGSFDIKTFLDGAICYVLWAVGAAFTVAGAQIYGGDLEITVGETTVTLLEAIELAKKTVYMYWAAKALQNFIEYSNVKTTVEAVDIIPVDEAVEADDTTDESKADVAND